MNASVAVFDAYGTLFDVHSAVARFADALKADAARISELWRQKQLEYTWTRSLIGRYVDFWEITKEALSVALVTSGYNDPGLRTALLEAYRKLDAYPDVPVALAGYRALGIRTVLFSNATAPMLMTALAATGLTGLVDRTFSADDQGIYKPSPRVYAAVTEALDVASADVIFHSSNAWDAAGAAAFGWRVLWINRAGRPREYPWVPMTEVADLHAALATTRGNAASDR